jgi:hypothetical protein
MSKNRSDYNKPRFNINDYLPIHLRNELSTSLFENVHNRFLTKGESVYQRGTIGKPTFSSTDRLPENSIFRQAYQLQPHMSVEADSSTKLMNWLDIVGHMKKLGVDVDQVSDWASTEQFNFAPPINPDKLINYRDYYWVGNTTPEYITIQNLATTYQNRLDLLNNKLTELLSQVPVDQVAVDNVRYEIALSTTQFNIASNASVGWDTDSFDDNGGYHVTISVATNIIDFGISLVGGLQYTINGVTTNPSSVSGSVVTFPTQIEPTDDVVVNLPWFYGVNPGSTPTLGTYGWFNTTDGKLYKYDTTNSTWAAVDPQPSNNIGFDQFINRSFSDSQWSDTNYWVHRQFIADFNQTTQAQIPIIEYMFGTKLNEYLRVGYHWKYRATANDSFQSVSAEPSVIEMSTRYDIINASPILDQYYQVTGDQRSLFTHGMVFSVQNKQYPFEAIQQTTQESTWDGERTTIFVTNPINITVPADGAIVPTAMTSLGDQFLGFPVHWVLDYIDRPIPGDVTNPYSPSFHQQSLVVGSIGGSTISGQYNSTLGHWDLVGGTGGSIPSTIQSGDTVYVSGTDQLLTLIRVSNSSFTLSINGSPYVGTAGATQVFLATKYVFADNLAFLGGSDNLRIYINQKREYDSYVESYFDPIQLTTTPAVYQQDGNAIVFTDRFPNQGDIIYIESHVVSLDDLGRELVGVRRSESDVYSLEQRSLVRYFRNEQIKYETNQYPLFDIFDHTGAHTGQISPIWYFKEDPSYANNSYVNKRIKVTDQRKVYYYTNDLVNEDNGPLLTYKRMVSGSYVLKTVWEFCKTYSPSLVNASRQHNGDIITNDDGTTTTIVVDQTNGDWELPDQMFYNPTHESRRDYSSTDIFAHYNSIIVAQPIISGVDNISRYNIGAVVDFDYTVGGTIKEHNHAFDDWASSLFATNVTALDIIDFAKQQHVDLINVIKNQIITSYGDLAATSLTTDDIKRQTIESIIYQMFRVDSWYGKTYGDSHSYDGQYGIPNVLTTVSRMGLWPIFRPSVSTDNKLSISQLNTHIGGTVDLMFNQQDLAKLSQRIIASSSCISSPQVPTVDTIVPGQYWYNTATRQLYRYTISYQQQTAPNPASTSTDALWLNTSNNVVSKMQGGTWVVVETALVLTKYLQPLSIDHIVSGIMLSFENKLFQVAAANQPAQKYDYTTLLSTEPRASLYNQYLRDCFYQYCKSISVDPFKHDDYLITDPFTWNYRNARNVYRPNLLSGDAWAGHTNGIYTLLFNTPVPHLEPWKLQGYTSKPAWWNQQYSSTTRRWNYDHSTTTGMWANIMSGTVPAGNRYPSGVVSTGNSTADGQSIPTYSFVPVNITNASIAGYAPDDLLPVYISNPTLSQFAVIRSQSDVDMMSIGDSWLFGDYASTENTWRTSIDYVYDQLIIASRIDPIRFFFHSFGREYVTVDRINIDLLSGKVCNHADTVFHGQFPPQLSSEASYLGVNQWYANYFRFHDIDPVTSNLFHMWTNWDIISGYSTDTIIDDKSIDVFTKCDKLTAGEFGVVLKKSAGVDVIDVDNLIINTVSVGAHNITYNARSPRGYGSDWVYQISTSSPIPKIYEYYAVKRYGAHYLSNSNFELQSGHKLSTGDLVRLYSDQTLPIPLNIFDDYYAVVNGNQLQLAHNKASAMIGSIIPIISGNSDPFIIGAVRSTFVPLDGAHTGLVWTTYMPDTDVVLTTSLPREIGGVQGVLDFVVGYSSRLTDLGVTLNSEITTNTDPSTGWTLTWDLEMERLVDQIYVGLGTSINILKDNQPVLSKQYVELNPFRQRCYVSPSRGMIGNVFGRSTNYLRGDPLVYDQTGRFFTDDQLFVFRQDRETSIQLDTNRVPQPDPLNSIHVGGMRLLTDYYEHTITFGRGSNQFGIIYDPYLGAEIASMFVAMQRGAERTGRINVGGYFNHNGAMIENIEKTASNSAMFYDAYSSDEFAGYPEYARAILGYDDPKYLDGLRLTNKSKFNFWRGMIQTKGSKRAIDAMQTAKTLASIDVDEFWAYRKAKFGSSVSVNNRLDIKIGVSDVKYNRVRFYFPVDGNLSLPSPYIAVNNAIGQRFDDYINKRQILDSMQNFYVSPALTNVTDQLIVKVNQIQVGGTTQTVQYVNTTEPFDGFAVLISRDRQIIGNLSSTVNIPVGQSYVDLDVPIDQPISIGRGETEVVINGKIGTYGIDYFEQPHIITVRIYRQLTSPTWIPVVVSVSLVPFQLVPDLDYMVMNSRTCRIEYDLTGTNYTIYGIRPDYKRYNSVEIIDKQSNAIVKSVPIIAPHHGQFDPQVMLSAGSRAHTDPAKYTNTLVPSDVNTSERWGKEKMGTTWVDDSRVNYTEFFNSNVNQTTDDQLNVWGEMIPGSLVSSYTWVQSPVHPSEWDNYVTSYSDPEGIIKLSGTPIRKLYQRNRPDTETAFGDWFELVNEEINTNTFAAITNDLTSLVIANPFTNATEQQNTVELFINGAFIQNLAIDLIDNTITLPTLPTASDVITMRLINTEWRAFDQLGEGYDGANSTTDLIEYQMDTPYSITTEYIGVGELTQPVNVYHFWVRNSNDPINTSGITSLQLANRSNQTTGSFVAVAGLHYDRQYNNTTKYRYSTVVVSDIEQMINVDDRYALRIKVADSLVNNSAIRSDVHYEWEMFREHQTYAVPLYLWNKLVESVIGVSITDPSTPVPSLERNFYDQLYNTNSRFGIGYDQSLGESQDLLRTIVAVISDPSVDAYPIDKDDFFDKYSFDTKDNQLIALDYIYTYFPVSVVNRIMIEVIKDFFVIVPNDPNIMKTSWVSISGTTTVEI